MNSLTANDCQSIFAAMAASIHKNREMLSALDAALGDGDHGFNMDAAMQAAVVALESDELATPAQVFKAAGNILINEMGGASGIIFGSFFTGGARAIKEDETVSLSELILFFAAGTDKVQKRGKAKLGDKTLLDSLIPAKNALELAQENEATLATAMLSAAQAAQLGAASTKELVAQHGRAKFLGERSLGHQDAGATSMALMLQTWANCVSGENNE